MPVLLSSRDIFLSTQQSGSVGTAESSFDKFRMCMNTSPITCDNGQMIKLSLTQFFANRPFYLINKFNNRFDIYVKMEHVSIPGIFKYFQRAVYLEERDYTTIEDIEEEFAKKLVAALKRFGVDPEDIVYTAPNSVTAKTHKRLDVTLTYKSLGGDGVADGSENAGAGADGNAEDHRIVDIKIICPQFHSKDPTTFNDSYIILGGKRHTTDIYDGQSWVESTEEIEATPDAAGFNALESSFDVTVETSGNFSVKGYFPMELQTNNFVYLRCHEAGTNLQSQNLNNTQSGLDTHMVSSSILAKLPITDTSIALQFGNDTPSFLYTSNQHISEVLFELVDHHGRPLPKPLLVVDKNTTLQSHANSYGHICDFNEDAILVDLTPNQYSLLDYSTNKAYFHVPENTDNNVSGDIVSESDADYDIQAHGSMFNDMSLKVEVYATGGNEHTLKAPHQDWNYLKNTTSQVQSFFPH